MNEKEELLVKSAMITRAKERFLLDIIEDIEQPPQERTVAELVELEQVKDSPAENWSGHE